MLDRLEHRARPCCRAADRHRRAAAVRVRTSTARASSCSTRCITSPPRARCSTARCAAQHRASAARQDADRARASLLFGDNPLGWRAMSSAGRRRRRCSASSPSLWLLLARACARRWSARCSRCSTQRVFVQARIAMLDAFLAAFLVLGDRRVAVGDARRRRGRCGGAGSAARCCSGWRSAVKWAAVPYVALRRPCVPVVCGASDAGSAASAGHAAALPALAMLGAVSIARLFRSPSRPPSSTRTDPLTLAQADPVPARHVRSSRRRCCTPHTYQSDWWSWPLMIRPIWYFYERADRARSAACC